MRVLDIGTGSGALAVAVAVQFPRSEVVAIDISSAALAVARGNAERNGVAARVGFMQGDLVQAVRVRCFDVIVANLPYVPESRRSVMSREVLGYEPELALFAGWDGLEAYRRLADGLAGNTTAGAVLLCEIDFEQGEAIANLFAGMAQRIDIINDHAGLERIAVVVF